jgi:hypothetical protein
VEEIRARACTRHEAQKNLEKRMRMRRRMYVCVCACVKTGLDKTGRNTTGRQVVEQGGSNRRDSVV